LLDLITDHANVMPKPKQSSMLPLLTVLFLISYGLMAMLVVEQGRTIDSQRYLIKQLFTDSSELTSMKGTLLQKQRAQAKAQAEANARSQAQAPSSQAQAPSSQVAPRDNAKSSRNPGKFRRPAPLKPPRNTSDVADERRALFSI
jgi:hypothetical protein